MKDLFKQLNEFNQIEPDEKYWHINRAVLVNQIEGDIKSKRAQRFNFESLFFNLVIFFRSLVPGWKFVSISLSVMVVVSSTFFGAQASMPGNTIGNILYPVKIGIEKAEIILAKDDISKTNILLEQASKRLEEMNHLIKKEKNDDLAKVSKNLKNNLIQANDNLKNIGKNVDKKEDLIELAKIVNKENSETMLSLRATNSKEINEVIKVSQELSDTVIEIIMNSKELADDEQKLINESINNRIKLQEEELAIQIDQNIKDKNDKEIELLEINDNNEKLIEITKTSTDTPEIIEDEIIEFNIDNIEEATNTEGIKESLEKAKALLGEGNYNEAYIETKKVEFYIELAKDILDDEEYQKETEKIKEEIEEVKSETEQVIEN
ncbi:DUF5667 domain-containing protein [bacterium]|nr:DUF5667 domain-containing protein [bacterium]